MEYLDRLDRLELIRIICIGFAGAAGTVLRYLIAQLARPWSMGFPFSTLSINLVGCFLIGMLHSLLRERTLLGPVLTVGLLGGFTTFSAFGLESWQLLEQKRFAMTALYACSSVILGAGLAGLGAFAARGL